jgi:stage II sporulation protein D
MPQMTVAVRIAEEGRVVRRIPLEEYVAGTIISEVAPPSGDEAVMRRMFEVQAVVARTYAVANRGRHRAEGFDLCSTTHCQLYEPSRLKTSRWAASGRAAAQRTAGGVLWYADAPASALFHADCGGHTSTAAAVWGGTPRPYLPAAADDGVGAAAHAAWRYGIPAAALLRALNANEKTAVGNRIDAIRIIDRDAAGRAGTIGLHGARERLVRGEDLRAVLASAFGPRSIRSTLFTVSRSRDAFVFEGRGFGHGVGLCQAGALARLQAGATPDAVLRRYFPQTRVRALGH